MKLRAFLPVFLFTIWHCRYRRKRRERFEAHKKVLPRVIEPGGQWGQSLVVRSVRSPARLAGFSASTIVHVSANMLCNSGTPHTAMAANCASARYCRPMDRRTTIFLASIMCRVIDTLT